MKLQATRHCDLKFGVTPKYSRYIVHRYIHITKLFRKICLSLLFSFFRYIQKYSSAMLTVALYFCQQAIWPNFDFTVLWNKTTEKTLIICFMQPSICKMDLTLMFIVLIYIIAFFSVLLNVIQNNNFCDFFPKLFSVLSVAATANEPPCFHIKI